jgi:hypothetical protein
MGIRGVTGAADLAKLLAASYLLADLHDDRVLLEVPVDGFKPVSVRENDIVGSGVAGALEGTPIELDLPPSDRSS